jgi:two-component system NarL family response regulator
MMSKIKIAIADDNKQFRRAIKALFKTERDFEIILEADNGVHLLEQLKTEQPDIVLMDIRMPRMDGIEASKKVKEIYPNIKIITFSQYDYESNIVEMYAIGVKSFIGKGDSPDELFKAIRTVHTSGSYMTDLATGIIQRRLAYKAKESNNIQVDFDCTPLLKLTQRELEVLWHVSQLKSMKEIAELLFISLPTVNNHEANIRHKLNIHGANSLQRYSLSAKDKLICADGIVELKK